MVKNKVAVGVAIFLIQLAILGITRTNIAKEPLSTVAIAYVWVPIPVRSKMAAV
jgi:hypothetical protein